jgi:peptidyl-prolyl cis-trans isomerase B (cyclophilin B)
VVSKRRQRELARQRHLRRQQQQAERRSRARRRNAVIGAVLAVLLVLGGAAYGISFAFTGSSGNKAAATPTPTPTPSATQLPCAYSPSGTPPKGKNVGVPSTSTLDPTHPYLATMKTNRGTGKFQLLSAQAPCTVNSFRYLAGKHFFNGTPCHRLTSGTLNVLQCGDPTGTGTGGPGYQFPDENLTGASYPAGTVAMANSGPNTNGSQFFLVYKDSQLGPAYTPFGKVISGLNVLTAIAAKGSTPPNDGKPKESVVIQSFTVTRL